MLSEGQHWIHILILNFDKLINKILLNWHT